MRRYELQIGETGERKKFYSISSVLKRLPGNMYNPLIYLAMNYGHIKQTRAEAKRVAELKPQLFNDRNSFADAP